MTLCAVAGLRFVRAVMRTESGESLEMRSRVCSFIQPFTALAGFTHTYTTESRTSQSSGPPKKDRNRCCQCLVQGCRSMPTTSTHLSLTDERIIIGIGVRLQTFLLSLIWEDRTSCSNVKMPSWDYCLITIISVVADVEGVARKWRRDGTDYTK